MIELLGVPPRRCSEHMGWLDARGRQVRGALAKDSVDHPSLMARTLLLDWTRQQRVEGESLEQPARAFAARWRAGTDR